MIDLVFLPATDPDDHTFGTIPESIESHPHVAVHAVQYPTLVWYNAAVREEAIAQIRSMGVASAILVGFSKSGLGAWNIMLEIPDLISGAIIFDAPVDSEERQRFGAAPFYRDDASWRRDLPVRIVRERRAVIPEKSKVALISGESFHEEMCALSHAMDEAGLAHAFLPRPHIEHHWNSGWIEEGLSAMLEPGVAQRAGPRRSGPGETNADNTRQDHLR